MADNTDRVATIRVVILILDNLGGLFKGRISANLIKVFSQARDGEKQEMEGCYHKKWESRGRMSR